MKFSYDSDSGLKQILLNFEIQCVNGTQTEHISEKLINIKALFWCQKGEKM